MAFVLTVVGKGKKMARTEYPDPDAEAAYQNVVTQSSRPSAYMPGTRPEASLGGRSQIEVNTPEAGGPSDTELEARKREFERRKKH